MDHKGMTKIDLALEMDRNIANIKNCLSMMMFICVKQHLSNI